ncbi:MAG: ABC transporter substrate-binding protein [Actinobacteria bacterium]|nr:MAG: ABC transporter substrate-binding protein [Actinomycetota bacterium]
MDRETRRRLEHYRRDTAGDVENTLIDEFLDGEMDRSDFLRRGSVFGLSLTTLGAVLAAAGEVPVAFARSTAAKVGGRLRVGCIPPPAHGLDPHTYADTGSLVTGNIAGEMLNRTTDTGKLVPELAVSWKSNPQATVWTFNLRQGVKFQNGQEMTADDVVATFKRLVDPNSGSQALSAYKGVISPAGVQKVDSHTVAFHLDAPTGGFPYLTSSTTYQAIILPANYQLGTFEKTPQCTGAFKLVSYTPGVGATYERFDGWWGGKAPLDGVDLKYFSDDAAVVSALLGNQIDLINEVHVSTGRALFNNPNVQVISAKGATHRLVPMLTDAPPFNDWRVRQAVALTLDRVAIRQRLFSGFASLGNDTPFAPVFASSVALPQRHKDIAKAKQLMAAAGKSSGFSTQLTTYKAFELPALAQIIQSSVKAIGIKMGLRILTSTAYYAGSQLGPPKGWGTTPWLNTPINITDWGGRAIPNVYLTSSLETKGVWNASHYSNKKFDKVAKSYIAAISLKDQRKYAKLCELILQHDTPAIYPYFYYQLGGVSKKVKGYHADPQGQVYLSHVSLA